MGSVFHSDGSSLPLLVSSPLTSLLTRWPVLSNYCLSFFLSLSATLMPLLPCGSLHAIPLFLISFIEIARQKSLLITYKFPRWSLLMKWSQKRFDKKIKNPTIESTEERCIARGVICSLHCRPCRIILCKWVGTAGRVPVAHAEPSKVLNRKMQSVSQNRAWARSLKSSHTLNFQSDSHWFNVSQLKATTLKGNQCNGFLASLLFLSPLWFPLVQTSSPLAIN